MSTTEETTIKLKAVYNDTRTHRYSLTKIWNSKKSKALVIMKNPSSDELLETDLTTMLVMNNLSKLDYGSVTLCNLISNINAPYIIDVACKEHTENFEEILKCAKTVDYVIIGWGTYGVGNVKVQTVQDELLNALLDYKEKLMYIANPKSPTSPVHPLYPLVRSNWLLQPLSNLKEFEKLYKQI